MTTYSNYDTTSSVVDTHYTFTCYGISTDAVRYSAGSGLNIAFETSTNAPAPIHVWRDDGGGYPLEFSHSSSGPWSTSVTDAATIYMASQTGGNGIVGSFSSPQWQYSSANPANSGPTPDQYGRLPSTAVSKSVNLGRVSYRESGPGDNVVIDINPTLVTGGYQTLNVPSAIFCPRDRAKYKDALFDRTLFENLKQNYTRNGITYDSYIFGGTIPNVLDNIYNYVELQAGIPFQFNSTGDWYVNYTTHAYRISDGQIVEIITGFSHNPAHSVLLRYNITTNAWIGVLANITETPRITLKTLKLQSVSPNSTQQWNGFSNLSNTTVDLLRFMVDIDTNVGSTTTPPQSEVEVAKNGGGKPDRYPLIMTNLFNRNRSIYSIGMTHKDTWDLFL